MYYNGARNFVTSFLVSLITSIIVCVLFFFVLPIARSGGDIVVPDMIGSTTEQARAITEARNLLLMVGGEEENDKYSPNVICRQVPLAGSVVREKSTITVFISKGSDQIIMPDFKGQGLSEVTMRLSDHGLKLGEIRTEENAEVEKDKVISTIPASGSRVKKGDTVTLVMSRGVEMADVPRVIGRALATAKRIVEENGFTVGSVTYEVSTEYDVGIIMSQNPRSGTKVKKGSKINLIVATVLE